jgi:hypothetical protein
MLAAQLEMCRSGWHQQTQEVESEIKMSSIHLHGQDLGALECAAAAG